MRGMLWYLNVAKDEGYVSSEQEAVEDNTASSV